MYNFYLLFFVAALNFGVFRYNSFNATEKVSFALPYIIVGLVLFL